MDSCSCNFLTTEIATGIYRVNRPHRKNKLNRSSLKLVWADRGECEEQSYEERVLRGLKDDDEKDGQRVPPLSVSPIFIV